MKLIPTIKPIVGKREDCIQTPSELCWSIIKHFSPYGIVLEPCEGDGNFTNSLITYMDCFDYINEIKTCEIKKGKDFFDFREKVDWIITNPPFSKIRKFTKHSMHISDNIVFLTTINHLWLKARLRDIEENHFGICEILLTNTPKTFPQSGFQVGVYHLKRNYKGSIKFGKLKDNNQTSLLVEKTKNDI
tara:strand:+ start:528 stop:1094 length:567 start_codon:yes stop_codon:yes gene_type:complete